MRSASFAARIDFVDHGLDELLDGFRAPQSIERRGGSMVGERLDQRFSIFATVSDEPLPKINAFAGSTNGSPGTDDQGEIQEDDRVRRSEPGIDDVVRPQVPIHDPGGILDEPILDAGPLVGRQRLQVRLPEYFVEFDDGQASELAQGSRERRLS